MFNFKIQKTMKKLLLMGMLLVAMMVQAQTKIAPKMDKGMKKVYDAESVINVNGQKDVKLTSETTFTVKEATAAGYVVEMIVTKVEGNSDNSDMTGRIMLLSEQMMTNLPMLVETDKDGKPLRVQNFESLKEKMSAYSDKLIDELLKEIPQLTDMMSKETLKQQVMSSVTEETLLKSVTESSNPMTLNGKTITMGAQDEYVNNEGMKMKRMYFTGADGTITVTANLNMSKDELKQFIIGQVEKQMPDQAEMLKNNIDMLMGNLKFEDTEKAIYTLASDGWVKTIVAERSRELMGQKMSTKVSTTLKD